MEIHEADFGGKSASRLAAERRDGARYWRLVGGGLRSEKSLWLQGLAEAR